MKGNQRFFDDVAGGRRIARAVRNFLALVGVLLFAVFVFANEGGYFGQPTQAAPGSSRSALAERAAGASPVPSAPPLVTPRASSIASSSDPPVVGPRASPSAPTPSVIPGSTAVMAPTTAPLASTPVRSRLVVANTGGRGAILRRAPQGEQVAAWRDGSEMVVIGPDAQVDGETWKNVRDPLGNVGWIYAPLLAESSASASTAAPQLSQ